MNHTMVRYRVKPEHVEENEALVRAVYAELGEHGIDGLRYTTFKCDDGVSFVHIASWEGEAAPLRQIAAFRRFREGLEARCDEPPQPTPMTAVGGYA
jgi:quinol monooxygenase YgiN